MCYTIYEIAKLAIRKYNLEDSVSQKACEKRIRNIIKEKDIKSTEYKKMPSAKRRSKAFSSRIANKILDVYLVDYAYKRGSEDTRKKTMKPYKSASELKEIVKKRNGEYEDRQLALATLARQAQEPVTYNAKTDDIKITESSNIFIQKRNQMMLDAVFSKFYTFKSDDLLTDLNLEQNFHTYYDGDATVSDQSLLDKLEQWECYVEEKKGVRNNQ